MAKITQSPSPASVQNGRGCVERYATVSDLMA